MAAFPATISLASFDGSVGTVITGPAGSSSGYSIAYGDVNGDGFIDVILGATQANFAGYGAGSIYVVYGTGSTLPATIDLSALDGSTGFRIDAAAPGHVIGRDISVGDIDHDGVDDIIIGTHRTGFDGHSFSGSTYVVYGRDPDVDADFPAIVSLSAIDGASNTVGVRVLGGAGYEQAGYSVAAVPDINGDGVDDLIIGAPFAPGSSSNGAVYVVFGGALPAQTDLATLTGSAGFKITSSLTQDYFGTSVRSAGDINDDGIADLLIGAPGNGSGKAYVLFGKDTAVAGGFASAITAESLTGLDGFQINGAGAGDYFGWSLSAAGDVNGDGVDDIVVSAQNADPDGVSDAGAAYVIFGVAGWSAASIDVTALDGTNGFRIAGLGENAYLARSVSAAGDINGDGYGDVIVGGVAANGYRGAAYILFGGPALGGEIDVTTLDGSNGFRILSDPSLTFTLLGRTVSAAGDLNGDGFDDLIVSSLGVDSQGASYIVYGRPEPVPVVETGTGLDDSYTGGAADDDLSGAAGNDVLNGGLGADAMAGGIGDDTYYVDDLGDTTTEDQNEGVDTVRSTISWVLGANLEHLVLDGSADIDGTGNTAANILTGNDGANVLDGGDANDQLFGGLGLDDLVGGVGHDMLDGGAGADQMAGGLGDDTYVVDDLGDTLTETLGEGSDRVRAGLSWTLGDNFENLQLTGAGNIDGVGNALANQIDGNAGDNLLSGGGGNDIIRGGGGVDGLEGEDGNDQLLGGDGNDILEGGAQNDTLYGEADNDTLYGGAGTDTLDGGLGGDSLYGEDGTDTLNGGEGDDSLNGGDGNDVLRGGAGSDVLEGGLGDDTYFVDAGDTLVEAFGQGSDVVRASVSWTLGDNFERLVLDGAADLDGTGNGLVNHITGNAGANVLDGAGGADVLSGGLGTDTLIGGLGNDVMTGGGGIDSFVIRQESVFSSSDPQGRSIETDTISDYALGEDIIDLSAIDAVAGGADDAFSIVAAFDGTAGRMILKFAGGVTTLELDIDGDRTADYRLKINGDVQADAGDWVL